MTDSWLWPEAADDKLGVGYIYVMMSSACPELVKIGKTSKPPEERAQEVSQGTGVPLRFVVAYAECLPYFDEAEQEIHSRLRSVRENPRREFFRVPLKDAIAMVAETANKYRDRKAREDAWREVETRRLAAEAAAKEQQRQAQRAAEPALEGWVVEAPASYCSETEQGYAMDILASSESAAPRPATSGSPDAIVYGHPDPDPPNESLLRSPFAFALIFVVVAAVVALGFCVLFGILGGIR